MVGAFHRGICLSCGKRILTDVSPERRLLLTETRDSPAELEKRGERRPHWGGGGAAPHSPPPLAAGEKAPWSPESRKAAQGGSESAEAPGLISSNVYSSI